MNTRALRQHLDALLATQDAEARVQNDPIRFPHRYSDVRDVEISAFLAASYAYGKVDLFLGVLERIHAVMDAHGGPTAFVRDYSADLHGPLLHGIGYRWTRDTDLVWLFAALRHALGNVRGMHALFAGATAREALQNGAEALLTACVRVAPQVGRSADSVADLPRGLRYFAPSPKSGSGCKRGNLFLRWMVRHGDGVDLGVWTHLEPAALVMPIDRHIQRIAPLLGLVDKADGSWRTALQVTQALAQLCPEDPVRYDFALAHTGISDGCTGQLVPDVCNTCSVRQVCRHGMRLTLATG